MLCIKSFKLFYNNIFLSVELISCICKFNGMGMFSKYFQSQSPFGKQFWHAKEITTNFFWYTYLFVYYQFGYYKV